MVDAIAAGAVTASVEPNRSPAGGAGPDGFRTGDAVVDAALEELWRPGGGPDGRDDGHQGDQGDHCGLDGLTLDQQANAFERVSRALQDALDADVP